MIYLDTSFLAPFYIQEATSNSVETVLLSLPVSQIAISDWTVVEFASLLSRRVRMNELTSDSMTAVMQSFQNDATQSYTVFTLTTADFVGATEFIQQWETGLRAGDALHLAIARNHNVENLLSLDRGLIDAAQRFGIPADSAGVM
ncbi:MAG: type II toxin-antitoxin system VapC family toxin [Leptolyngbyaceae cyanobacterium CSU_1_3]|nr:type II toxin-antitoxin system VapC family toxin [Leptolyngbyaceae cyanobacterium CSU_1_3]